MTPCPDKARLLEAYRAATAEFSQLLTTLHQQIGTLSKDHYASLRRSVDDARVMSEQARLVLERHIAQHDC